ncbi:MAG: ribosome-binding ATPase YchF (GTP1/OBG family), partial [Bradymonadia bacterium]
PLRSRDWEPEAADALRMAGMITLKPVLFVCNVDEDGAIEGNELAERVIAHAKSEGSGHVVLCAQIEAEVSELDEEERDEFLSDLGLPEPGLHTLSRAVYALLGLQTYFTAGEKEIRAWTIPVGASAPQAAGVIHTDFERGFIRAQVFTLADLEAHQTEKAIREAGRLRSEGKEYVVQDGDIVHFLFNV